LEGKQREEIVRAKENIRSPYPTNKGQGDLLPAKKAGMFNDLEYFIFPGIYREGSIYEMDGKSRISFFELQANFFQYCFCSRFSDAQIPDVYE
jgi:hypothetical protein